MIRHFNLEKNPAGKFLLRLIPVTVMVLMLLAYTPFASAASGDLYMGFGAGAAQLQSSVDNTSFKSSDSSSAAFKIFGGYKVNRYLSAEIFYADLGTADITNLAVAGDTGTSGSNPGDNGTGTGGTGGIDGLGPSFPFPGINNPAGIDTGLDTGTGTARSATTRAATAASGEISYKSFGGHAVFKYPGNPVGLNAILKLGMGQLNQSTSGTTYSPNNSASVIGGVGFDYRLRNNLSIRGEYDYLDTDVQLASLNLLLHFGGPTALPSRSGQTPDTIGMAECTGSESNACTSSVVSERLAETRSQTTLPDSDHDGYPDGIDHCPNSKPNISVDATGCSVTKQFTGVLTGVSFQGRSDQLTKSSYKRLNALAEGLKRYPQVGIKITAHTDPAGNEAVNKALSVSQAHVIAQYLKAQGVSGKRIQTHGAGGTQPVSMDGKQSNQRIEIRSYDL